MPNSLIADNLRSGIIEMPMAQRMSCSRERWAIRFPEALNNTQKSLVIEWHEISP